MMIRTYTFDAATLTPSRREALAYLRVRGEPDPATLSLLEDCFDEAKRAADCRCRAGFLPLPFADEIHPALLETRLAGCDGFALFGVTVGVELDRLVARYTLSSPARAAVLDAVGGALAEALCDKLTETLAKEMPNARFLPRFSPGYGTFPLSAQRRVFEVLQLSRIGVGLNDSLLLSPAKTVTALFGWQKVR